MTTDGFRANAAHRPLLKWGIPFASVGAVALLRWLWQDELGQTTPFFLFVISTLVSAWFGGWWPGVLATGLGIAAGQSVFAPPAGSFAITNRIEWIQAGLFVFQGLTASVLCESLLRSRQCVRTQLRKIESYYQDLLETNSKMNSVLENVADGIFSADSKGRIQSWNKGAENLFGYPADEVVGRPVNLILPGCPVPDLASANGRENSGRRKDGSEFPVSFAVNEIQSPAGRKFVGIVRDVSECQKEYSLRLEKEAAERANRSKGRLVAQISHELRTPLGAILGFADFARSCDPRSAERTEALEVIHRNAQCLLALVNDLLDSSKLEAGKIKLETSPVHLRGLLDDVNKVAAERARSKGLDLRIECPTWLPNRLICDPLRLRQILLNLLSNAIKFTEKGRVTLRIHGALESESVYRLAFAVEDTGMGMDSAQQQAIFNEYGQADDSISRRFGGTGLGLVLARNLARLMGGDLRLVRSSPRQGSLFEGWIQARIEPAQQLQPLSRALS